MASSSSSSSAPSSQQQQQQEKPTAATGMSEGRDVERSASSKTTKTAGTLPSCGDDVTSTNLMDNFVNSGDRGAKDHGENGTMEESSLPPFDYILSSEESSDSSSVSSIEDDLSLVDGGSAATSETSIVPEKESKVSDEASVRLHQLSELARIKKQIETGTKRVGVLERRLQEKSETSFLEDRLTLATIDLEIKKAWDEYDALQDMMDQKGILRVFSGLRQRTHEKDQQITSLVKQQEHLSKTVKAHKEKTEELKRLQRDVEFWVDRRNILEDILRDHLIRKHGQKNASRYISLLSSKSERLQSGPNEDLNGSKQIPDFNLPVISSKKKKKVVSSMLAF